MKMYILIAVILLFIFVRKWNYINFVNPYISFFVGYFLFVVFGGFYDGVGHLPEIRPDVKLHVICGFVFLLLGGLFSELFFFINGKCTGSSVVCPPSVSSDCLLRKKYFFSIMTLILGWLITLYVYSRMSVIPMLSDNVHYYRVSELQGKGYYYHISRNLIYLSLCYLVTIDYVFRRKVHKFIWVLCIFSLIILLGYAIRADALKAIVFPGLVYFLFKFERPNKKQTLICLFLFVLLFLFNGLLQYIRHLGFNDLVQRISDGQFYDLLVFGWANVGHRFWVQLQNIEYIYSYIGPSVLTGKTYLNDFLILLPGKGSTSGVLLKNLAGVEFEGGGITPSIIGESYVNFGISYAMFMCFFVSFFLNSFYIYVKSKLKIIDPHSFSLIYPLFFILSFSLYGLASSSFVGVLIQSLGPLIASFFVYVFIYWFTQKVF